MLLKLKHEKENSHYFYVMGWKETNLLNAPIKKKKFDIFKNAKQYFKDLEDECAFVSMFEYIGGKRKWIADSEDKSSLNK